MNDNVIDITLKIQRIGSIIASDLKNILFKAYKKASKQLSSNSKLQFYSEVTFDTFEGDEVTKLRNPLISNTYKSSQIDKWVDHVEQQIFAAIQSDESIDLKSIKILFHFFIPPSGTGFGGTTSRDKEDILNKNLLIELKMMIIIVFGMH